MTYPFIFANLSGNQPASDLDTMYQIAGQQGALPCTASGTNTITLTSQTNVYTPAAYTDKQLMTFTSVATSTGTVTGGQNGLPDLPWYTAGQIAAGAGDIVINRDYLVMYTTNSALNSGAGAIVILNSTGTAAPSVPQPIVGSFKNLVITNTTAATPASQITVSFDECILENTNSGTVKIGSFQNGGASFTINANSTGANGIDTGTFAANPYFIWVFYNPSLALSSTNPCGVLSLSSSAPAPPSGYTYKARAGGCFAVAGPKLVNFMQKGRRAQNLVGTYGLNALANLPSLATGAAGSISIPTWVAVTLATAVPTTATSVTVLAITETVNGGGIIVAPNNNYGAYTSLTNPPPLALVNNNAATMDINTTSTFLIESSSLTTALYWASNAANSALFCLGWEDMVNA